MRILMVNKFLYPRGGAETYMLEIGAYLQSQGHQVSYFGMRDERNTVGNSLELETAALDFRSRGLGRILYPLRVLYSQEARRKIQRLIRAFSPDVIHLINIYYHLTPSIIDGAAETGVTIMKTDAGIDTGDMFLSAKTPIAESDTCGTLTERLGELGAELIVKAVKNIAIGSEKLTAQGEGFVCKKVSRTEVDFSKPAKEVCALIRGLSPAPLSFASVGGQTLNFYFAESLETDDISPSGSVLCASPKGGLVVKCGDGAVRITELQPAGGKRMSARDYLNGRKIREGMCFDKPVL